MPNQMNMNMMNDQIIATDLLLRAKTGVRNYAWAITETASDNIRSVLKSQLNDVISFHDQVFNYMVNKGYYSPYDVNRQIQIDMSSAQQVMGQQTDTTFSV